MEWLRMDIYCEQDAKIKMLIKRYGYEGFGLYWSLILYLANEGGSINHEVAIETLTHTWKIDEVNSSKWIDRFLEIGLIYEGEDGLQSNRLWAEIDFAEGNRKQQSDAGKKSGVSRRKKAGLPPVADETNGVQLKTNGVQLDVNGVPEKTNTDLQTYRPTDLQTNKQTALERTLKQPVNQAEVTEFLAVYPPVTVKRSENVVWREYQDARQTASFADIITGAKRYAQYVADTETTPKFTKAPANWLKEGCWTDEYCAEKKNPTVEDYIQACREVSQ
jgi:hypothetical protein